MRDYIDNYRYRGRVCAKHPDGEGTRYIRNGVCVHCQKAMNKASRQKGSEERRKKYEADLARLRAGRDII